MVFCEGELPGVFGITKRGYIVLFWEEFAGGDTGR